MRDAAFSALGGAVLAMVVLGAALAVMAGAWRTVTRGGFFARRFRRPRRLRVLSGR